ncbi:hypothetical protein SSPS47_18240 [Streptomyces sp. S4.7]|nr:hypothetical protein SSPS47_18240 [Streptomyces sp. S4.7]
MHINSTQPQRGCIQPPYAHPRYATLTGSHRSTPEEVRPAPLPPSGHIRAAPARLPAGRGGSGVTP